jgi:hypothetical protein
MKLERQHQLLRDNQGKGKLPPSLLRPPSLDLEEGKGAIPMVQPLQRRREELENIDGQVSEEVVEDAAEQLQLVAVEATMHGVHARGVLGNRFVRMVDHT